MDRNLTSMNKIDHDNVRPRYWHITLDNDINAKCMPSYCKFILEVKSDRKVYDTIFVIAIHVC